MDRTVSATEARVHFGELMRHVVETESPVVVERDGRPQVVVLSVGEYERLRAAPGAPPWQSLLQQAHALTREELGRRRVPPAADVIREMRKERDAELGSVPRLR